MPPRRKRIRSDDSENSTVDSRGRSSGSDIQNLVNGKNLRHQSKKVSSEAYDGDCELELPGKNRVKKTATRSRVLKQKPTNSFKSARSSSTPDHRMEVDDAGMLGFEHLITPIPFSPVSGHLISTPQSPVVAMQEKDEPVVMATPKPLFETPVEKAGKKFKRKRVAKHRTRQSQNRSKVIPNEDEYQMISHFNEIDDHELLIE